jgi:hypothetical protein
VLLTRGQPTVIYPESVLTFRIDQPVTIATDRAPQAFRYADAQDYGGPSGGQPRVLSGGPVAPPPPAYGSPYPPYPPYPYPYASAYPYPYAGFSVYVGPHYGYYYGRGYYGPYHRH